MKTSTFITLLSLTLLSCPQYIKAENSNVNSKEETGKRPETVILPAEDVCTYEDGYLYITLDCLEPSATLRISRASDGSCIMDGITFPTTSAFTYYIGECDEPLQVEITVGDTAYVMLTQ